jgi:hypothetical protein
MCFVDQFLSSNSLHVMPIALAALFAPERDAAATR